MSSSVSSTRFISATAWAIVDCIRTPRMSSFNNPISSTSSLSNSTIGYPLALNCTGARSSKPASERTTAHGCIAKCRGRPSRRWASEIAMAVRGADKLSERSSGSDLRVASIFRARICGRDFAIRSISIGASPKAAPVSRIALRAR